MKNKNGFTLIELLAILVIIGFIMIMIFPSLEGLRGKTDKEKYAAYEKMMIEYAEVSDFEGQMYICLSNLNSQNNNGLNEIVHDGFNGCVKKVNGELKVYIYGSEEGSFKTVTEDDPKTVCSACN